MKKKSAALAEYINVDLELRSGQDLQPLVDALSKDLVSLYAGREGRSFLATFENGAGARGADSPDRSILRMVAAVQKLPPKARRLWKDARDRVFDVGVAKTAGTETFYLPLAAETVRAVSAVGARIALSLYPPYYPQLAEA
jgi:hypothetical protein